MTKRNLIAPSLVLLALVLGLSGCANQPKEAPAAVAELEQVTTSEQAADEAEIASDEVADEPAQVQDGTAASAYQPSVVPPKKKLAKRKPAPPKAAPASPPAPQPVAAVEPVVRPPVEPAKSEATASVAPPTKVVERSFLEEYWLWLLILIIGIGGVVAWLNTRKE